MTRSGWAAVEAGPRIGDFADLRRALMSLETSPIVDLGRGVWVHGAGGFGQSVARALATAGVPLLGFLDRASDGRRSLDGLRVEHPDTIDDSMIEGTFHVHAVMNHYAPSRMITDWASARGFSGLLFPADLCRIPGVVIHNYWLAPPSETLTRLDAIERLHDGLADDESRALLRSLLVYRMTTDPRRHPEVRTCEAYIPDFLPIFDRPITFIDGGAYTGDTFEALVDRGVKLEDWIAFEPDICNMAGLRATAQRLGTKTKSFTLLQLGLSDRSGRVAFLDGGGEASHILAPSDITTDTTSIDAVRMDDVIQRQGNVYIKLDIEGAELEALRGMPLLLASNPVLAVSIYHRPEHLWEIPLFLMANDIPVQFRIRQHGHHGFDTVLYMSPK